MTSKSTHKKSNGALDGRRAGVLLHPTSLPGPGRAGEIGPEARRFVEFLAASGFSVWQTLPLGPTHEDNSPYQCLSSHAGDPRLISVERLAQWGWLPDSGDCADRAVQLRAARRYFAGKRGAELEEFEAFLAAHAYWLEDYVLYSALREEYQGRPWWEWPAPLRNREPQALQEARVRNAGSIAQQRFEQFVFFREWFELKAYANGHGVLMFGDMPIFVAEDSAEVWAQREYFAFDDEGRLQAVAGVPPDYFSATGQRWGNPHYRWERMEEDGFAWWMQRMRTQLMLFDLVRIDHFRGFESYWEIPAHAETAVQGRWVKAPGDALFKTLRQAFDPLPLVAEDLGVITPPVEAMRRRYGLPGMKILQFAFDGSTDNPYLPHNHEENSVVYTGTHDNNTTLGWFDELPAESRGYVEEYLGHSREEMPWPLIRAACESVARLAIMPMQDVLMLGSEHRMNLPGTVRGNWSWRLDWGQVPEDLPARLRHLVKLYGRCPFKA